MIGVDPGFLRALGRSGLLTPRRSGGGHRRYSRHDLDLAARAREVVDEGMTLAAACRIVMLEYELAQARDALAVLQRRLASHNEPRGDDPSTRQVMTPVDPRAPDQGGVLPRTCATALDHPSRATAAHTVHARVRPKGADR